MTTKQTIGLLAIAVGLFACNNNRGNGTNSGDTYQEKVQSVADIERSQPTRFLKASGNYRPTLFGNNLKINGTIKSTATAATFKDVVVKVTYYSQTKTVLGTNNYIIYEFFAPQTEKPFDLKIQSYQNVTTIDLDVVKATPVYQ